MGTIRESVNVSKLEALNMKSASRPFKSIIGETKEVKSLAIVEDVDKDTGELRLYSYAVDVDGVVYGGNSAVVSETMSDAIDYLSDIQSENSAGTLKMTVNTAKSNGGKDYIYLTWS